MGGTRLGVKCLHAHYAWFLAGGDDPVGAWVHVHLPIGRAAVSTNGRVAAIDVGTNSVRLLVAEPPTARAGVTEGGWPRWIGA